MPQIPGVSWFSADEVRSRLSFATAISAIEAALARGLDPESDSPRLFSSAPEDGHFLLMPAQSAEFCGLKALTVAPNNPAKGLEKIQGLYLLYSADSLAPIAVMDGACLTAIRTPAVTQTAIRHLARLSPAGADEAPGIVVFGAGTQAAGHVRAALVDFPRARFEIVGRNPARLEAFVAGLAAEVTASGGSIAAAASADVAVAAADIIITATTSSTPVFDGALVKDDAIIAATGTHGRDLRELDDAIIGRADIVVEGRGSAERENGNLVTSFDAERWRTAPPANLADLVLGSFARTPGRPACYTGVGMSWEDLVCASAVFATSERQ